MKNIAFLLLALAGLAVNKVSAQSTQNRTVSGFSSVANSGSFTVHIKITGTESLKITAGADIINEIETVVEGGTLQIRFKHQHEPHNFTGRVEVFITARSLSGLVCSGSGAMTVDGEVKGRAADITLSGSGTISSAIDAADLHVTISGSGSVNLSGKAGATKVTLSGSGKLAAKELSTDVADLMIAGSGSTYLTVNKTISGTIVGSGNVTYSGTATVSGVHTVGSGKIRHS
jgi:Putative auto-transporter adhesin, head GIN domain